MSTYVACPFCGGINNAVFGNEAGIYTVICAYCLARGPVGKSADEAQTEWGNRYGLPRTAAPAADAAGKEVQHGQERRNDSE